jgi:lysyl-tRNA synthetase class II
MVDMPSQLHSRKVNSEFVFKRLVNGEVASVFEILKDPRNSSEETTVRVD